MDAHPAELLPSSFPGQSSLAQPPAAPQQLQHLQRPSTFERPQRVLRSRTPVTAAGPARVVATNTLKDNVLVDPLTPNMDARGLTAVEALMSFTNGAASASASDTATASGLAATTLGSGSTNDSIGTSTRSRRKRDQFKSDDPQNTDVATTTTTNKRQRNHVLSDIANVTKPVGSGRNDAFHKNVVPEKSSKAASVVSVLNLITPNAIEEAVQSSQASSAQGRRAKALHGSTPNHGEHHVAPPNMPLASLLNLSNQVGVGGPLTPTTTPWSVSSPSSTSASRASQSTTPSPQADPVESGADGPSSTSKSYEKNRLGIKVPRLLHRRLSQLKPRELEWQTIMTICVRYLESDDGQNAIKAAVALKRSGMC